MIEYIIAFCGFMTFGWLLDHMEEDVAKKWAILTQSYLFVALAVLHLLYIWGEGALEKVGELTWGYVVYEFTPYFQVAHGNGYYLYDPASSLFALLTVFLTTMCVIIVWPTLNYRVSEFFFHLFLVQMLLIGIFFTSDLLVFYMLFEFLAVPMFFIIGIWGSRSRKIGAAYYLFFYTIGSSLLLLATIAFFYGFLGSTNYHTIQLVQYVVDCSWKTFMFWSLFISFAAKLPLVPLHLWLPEAHVEAPTVGSVLLAGILLKVGGFGIIRFIIPTFGEQLAENTVLLQTIGVVTAIYAFSSATVQVDIKKIVAYSSIGHMAFVLLASITFTVEGIESAIMTMLTHGFVSGAMFAIVGFMYDRFKTRNIFAYGGLAQLMPRTATYFFVLMLGNVSFPGTGAFISEIGVFLSVAKLNLVTTFWLLLSTVIGVVYNFWLYVRVFMGPCNNNVILKYYDLDSREKFVLRPFIALVFFSGIMPETILSSLHTCSKALISISFM